MRTFLGIETGATHTSVLLADDEGTVVDRFDLGPANIRLSSNAELSLLLGEIKERTGDPVAIGAGMAGVRNAEDTARMVGLAKHEWPETPFVITNDLETAIESAGPWPEKAEARVLLLSGTGSCAYGRNCEGRTGKFGGRGHILGDQGSACDISLAALRAIVYQHDLKAHFPALGEAVLRTLQLNHPDDLIPWTQTAEKYEIAALAITVFTEAQRNDRLAQRVIREAADKLADMAARCAEQLASSGSMVQFVLAGSTLLKQPTFAAAVSRRLHEQWTECRVEKLRRESVWGAVELARQAYSEGELEPWSLRGGSVDGKVNTSLGTPIPISALATAPTEMRNPKSMALDTMPLDDAIELMISENVVAVKAIRKKKADLKWLIEKTITAFKNGGRLFYVGAGTSGRLGVLDASECPPTFRAPPEQVQAIMAGGQRAIWSAVEGAEDNHEAGISAVRFRGVRKGDVLLGIASSGRTPYVWGALQEAKRQGAVTALLAFHPKLEVPKKVQPDRMILIDSGPEPLTGSTRLKAGTATKVVLNTLTTLAMVHTGKVLSNLMVDLNASNVKLKDRAVRLVRELTGCESEVARRALEESEWIVKDAVASVKEAGAASKG